MSTCCSTLFVEKQKLYEEASYDHIVLSIRKKKKEVMIIYIVREKKSITERNNFFGTKLLRNNLEHKS